MLVKSLSRVLEKTCLVKLGICPLSIPTKYTSNRTILVRLSFPDGEIMKNTVNIVNV